MVLALLAAAAYFQASGLNALLAAELSARVAPVPRRASAPSATAERLHETSALAILSRNPFDSQTGPLDLPAYAFPTPELARDDDPYADVACASTRVTFIAASDDDDWSFAVISAVGGKPALYRRGDTVAAYTVLHIGWDRVWLTGGDGRCQLDLHGDHPAAAPSRPAAPAARPGASLPPEIASKIQKVSETEFNVDRSAIDAILERQAELMKSARLAPVKQDGVVVGVRMQRIASGSLLDTLGLKRGDVLRSINGLSIADPEKALEAYARLRTADRLQVALRRGGKDTTLDFRIR